MLEESELITKIKSSYKTEKMMKKMSGKLTAYEIAFGRKLIKIMQKNHKEVKDA